MVICPKCGKEIRQIGVDYRKVGSWYKCSNGHFFGQPSLALKCSECHQEFLMNEAKLETLHQYKLTEKGQRQLRLASLKIEK